MRRNLLILSYPLLLLCLAGSCVTAKYSYMEPTYEEKIETGTVLRGFSLSPALEEKILALDPEHITERDIKEILSNAPAPRIINIHGGIYPVHMIMKSFSKFLILMGYPEAKIRIPQRGSYSYSPYEGSDKLAGLITWYYEKEGLRPMVIGHSQGGIQAVKVLHELAGTFSDKLPVWNPLTDKAEDRYSIVDPLTGADRPVVGMKISYASTVGAGGATRFLPNQWSMINKLRNIPDSVEEFTGFFMGLDFFGGDLLGFSSMNKYKPNGSAQVRNVRLPASYSHIFVTQTRHLADKQEIRDWINNYSPSEGPEPAADLKASAPNLLWAADVWHSIKKHWCLEIQNLIEARRNIVNGK